MPFDPHFIYSALLLQEQQHSVDLFLQSVVFGLFCNPHLHLLCLWHGFDFNQFGQYDDLHILEIHIRSPTSSLGNAGKLTENKTWRVRNLHLQAFSPAWALHLPPQPCTLEINKLHLLGRGRSQMKCICHVLYGTVIHCYKMIPF